MCVCVCSILDNTFANLVVPCNSNLTSWVEVVRDQNKAGKGTPAATPVILARGKRCLFDHRGMFSIAFL